MNCSGDNRIGFGKKTNIKIPRFPFIPMGSAIGIFIFFESFLLMKRVCVILFPCFAFFEHFFYIIHDFFVMIILLPKVKELVAIGA